ncbi:hypothetical protein [uncultured Frigoribacterium sp.]|uniref:hypothetical protein n=1 Tax=uncultured Frigoribacterium sp. TaxID=335377 RepID=UPI0028D43A32|nr:hypothetical protein [uncultured Frigoribacterium sp.]
MRMNTRLGRIMYGISFVVSVGMIVVVWAVLQPSVVFSVSFTLFVVGIAVWNGRKAFGASPEPR